MLMRESDTDTSSLSPYLLGASFDRTQRGVDLQLALANEPRVRRAVIKQRHRRIRQRENLINHGVEQSAARLRITCLLYTSDAADE